MQCMVYDMMIGMKLVITIFSCPSDLFVMSVASRSSHLDSSQNGYKTE